MHCHGLICSPKSFLLVLISRSLLLLELTTRFGFLYSCGRTLYACTLLIVIPFSFICFSEYRHFLLAAVKVPSLTFWSIHLSLFLHLIGCKWYLCPLFKSPRHIRKSGICTDTRYRQQNYEYNIHVYPIGKQAIVTLTLFYDNHSRRS